MSDYTIMGLSDVENYFATKGWDGEMRFLTSPLEAEKVAITYRKMPQHTGGKGGYGHYHKVQEEIVYLIKGELEVKVDDKVEILRPGQAIRIAPKVVRSLWNDKPEDVELLIISQKTPEGPEDGVTVADFWPAD